MRRRRTREEERLEYKRKRLLYPDRMRARSRAHYSRNRERILQQRRDRFLALATEAQELLKLEANRRSKEWSQNNPHRRKEIEKRYRNNNSQKRAEHTRRWKQRSDFNRARKIRMEADANFALNRLLSCRVRGAVRRSNAKKCASTALLVGCSIQQLRRHLEKQFQPGMTWENMGRGGWSIDHRVPLAEFDLRSEFQQLQAFHYSNLQPLWEKQNLSKGAKLTEPYQRTLSL